MKEKYRFPPGSYPQNARIDPQPTQRALQLTDFYDPKTDPLGSYTGQPVESDGQPVQDVDDL